ncbi:SAM-dependent methyltransferase [Kribbella aluminosa]|uniref:SAM-dependent methyltransferase n=1 Tax=Kribbella aluminosa TaxID=416017 RepID=A0ABS4UXQ3_9ACTN|nr:class I SAM-dependent methyltransferase [Kribbella aluminosa]MBP2356406.1 SAM-dependent methyltransferase [Kribbella aluminosa]
MSEHTARAIRLFDELAADYDEVPLFFRGFAQLHADWLDPQPGTAALDLGATFDLVCAGFVMHLLDDPAATAAEIHRVLRPGGVFSFSIPCDVENAPDWDFYGALIREYQPYIPVGKGRLGRPLDGQQLLAAEGFHNLNQTEVSQHLPDPFWNWSLSHGSRAFIDALPHNNAQPSNPASANS